MTFATEAAKSASERFVLVKIEPRKFLGVGTLISANTYTFSPGLTRVDEVQVNGLASSVSSFTYANGLLTVVSGINLASATNIVTCDFYQFYTGTEVRDTAGNTASLPEEIWEPYIQSYPSWSQSMKNIADGFLTISSSEITLISENRILHDYFGEDYSWYKAPVTVWACINSVNNARMVFSGEVASTTLSSGTVSLSVLDNFQKLGQTATFGTRAESYVYTGNSYGGSPAPADENRPIPMVLGTSSPIEVGSGYRHLDPFGSVPAAFYHLKNGLKAIRTSPATPTGTSTQTFVAGKVLGDDIKRISFGTITAAYVHWVTRQVAAGGDVAGPTIWMKMIYIQCSSFNGEIGDYIPSIGTSGGGPTAGWVCRKEDFTHAATTWNVALFCPDYNEATADSNSTSVPTSGTTTVTISNNTHPSMSVWIEGGDQATYKNVYEPLALVPSFTYMYAETRYLPFSWSVFSPFTFNGQDISILGFDLDPAACKMTDEDGSNNLTSGVIKCRFSPENPISHGDAMEFILTAAGLEVDAASITAADAAVVSDLNLCTPGLDGGEFKTYQQLAQMITSSTLGMILTDENRVCKYVILDDIDNYTPTGTRDTVNVLAGSTSTSVEFQDIYTTTIFENPTYKGVEVFSSSYGPAAVVENTKARALHRVDRSRVFQHYLVNIQGRKEAIAGYAASPKVEYNLSTSSEDLTSNIGDVVTFENPTVAGESETVDGLIVDIQASGPKTKIIINELRGIT